MDRARRRWCAAAAALVAAPPWRALAAAPGALRIGVTAVILDDQAAFLEQWRAYLEHKLGRPVRFVHRGTYGGISDLLRQRRLDFAWICGAPYVRLRGEVSLIAVPLSEGKPLYRSYLIVPAGDHGTESLAGLRGRVFAYSDPESNSGYLYTQYRLLGMGERPARFFGRTFFTWTHRNVVTAVANELAHGGSVDGHVWETLRRDQPALALRTRVVERSPEFGFPPLVARIDIPPADAESFRRVLLGMTGDAEGRRLLGRLNLDGFATASPALFDGIAHMRRVLDAA